MHFVSYFTQKEGYAHLAAQYKVTGDLANEWNSIKVYKKALLQIYMMKARIKKKSRMIVDSLPHSRHLKGERCLEREAFLLITF